MGSNQGPALSSWATGNALGSRPRHSYATGSTQPNTRLRHIVRHKMTSRANPCTPTFVNPMSGMYMPMYGRQGQPTRVTSCFFKARQSTRTHACAPS